MDSFTLPDPRLRIGGLKAFGRIRGKGKKEKLLKGKPRCRKLLGGESTA